MKRAGKMAVWVIGRLVTTVLGFALGVFLPALLISLDSPPQQTALPQPSPTPSDTASGSHNEQAAGSQVAEVRPPNEDDSPCWFDSASDWENFPPLVISPERVLIVAGCTLYMMDSGGRVIWQSSGWPPFTDRPIVDSTGTIYVIALDLTHAAIDADTGRHFWTDDVIGSKAYFSRLARYREDQHLVLVDLTGYDEGTASSSHNPNRLKAYRGTEFQWAVDFPRNAELKVENGRIYAMSRSANGVEVTEIRPPNNSQRQENER